MYGAMDKCTSSYCRRSGGLVTVLCALSLLCGARFAHGAVQPIASIRQAAVQFVQAQMPAAQQDIVVRAGHLDPRLRLARCAAPLQASLLEGARLQANMSVAVGCRAGAEWTIYVPVSVASKIRVWALRHPQNAGTRLTAADLEPETRLVSGMAAGYVTDLALLSRSTLRHPMPAGAVLHASDLLAEFMVHQGQQVALVASVGGVQVRASGIALQDGRYGALIRVQNPSSQKVVQGTVGGAHVVYVSP